MKLILSVIAFIWIFMAYSYHFREIIYLLIVTFIIFTVVCFILKKWRCLITFCLGMTFIFLSLKLFGILGGLVK